MRLKKILTSSGGQELMKIEHIDFRAAVRFLIIGSLISIVASLTVTAVLCYKPTQQDSAQVLKWSSTHLSLQTSLDRTPESITFLAQNVSGNKVHIKAVTPSCGCVQCDYYPKDLGPNDWLHVCATASSDLESEKTVVVETDNASYRLLLSIRNNKEYIISNRVFIWHVGDKSSEKRSDISLLSKPQSAKIICTDPRVFANLTSTPGDPAKLVLRIQPKDTKIPFIANFSITIFGGNLIETTIPLYAIVLI